MSELIKKKELCIKHQRSASAMEEKAAILLQSSPEARVYKYSP